MQIFTTIEFEGYGFDLNQDRVVSLKSATKRLKRRSSYNINQKEVRHVVMRSAAYRILEREQP